MTTPGGFVEQHARLFLRMADIASQNLTEDPFLPDGWVLLKRVVSDGSRPAPVCTAQGFYAKGPLDDSSGKTAAVLALGITWPELLKNFRPEQHAPQYLPDGIIGKDAPTDEHGLPNARFEEGYASSYDQVRSSIWANLEQSRGLPLYVVGKGPGAPLAQLAALDLRPENKGPAAQTAPKPGPVCYTFSTPPAGNRAFAQYYDAKVKESYAVLAGTSDLPVDLFPTAPDESKGYALPGQRVDLRAALPAYDDPWLERSGNFYLKVLGGTPDGPPPTPGQIQNPPPGFDRTLAYVLARLCAVAYQRRQHPNAATIDIGSYTVRKNINSGGVPFGTLFSGPDAVAVAFRGTVTWDELARFQLVSYTARAGFIADEGAYVHQGALKLYTAAEDDAPNARPFRQALAEELQHSVGGKKLYLAGHSFGGVIASLAALDLKLNYPVRGPAKVYTFGSSPVGTFEFAQRFDQALGQDSYHVFRTGDFTLALEFFRNFEPLKTPVRLAGVPQDDDETQHPLSTYIDLLNPQS